MRSTRRGELALIMAAVLVALAGAVWVGAKHRTPSSARHPWLVIGIDGATWTVIDRLWERGELPHLRALAGRGSRAVLHTAYNASPVIWTTIATGRRPRDHGITDRVRVRCSVTIVVLAPGSPGARHELRRSHRAGR